MKTVFPIRMLYAVTPQAREKAAQMGCNWALVYTMGHKAHRSNENPRPNDDLPVRFATDRRVAALRRVKRKAVAFEQRVLRESVAHAHALGLKAMIHSYEVSLPPELRMAYPSLYRPMVREYRNCCAETRANREPCLSDPDVRDLISAKVAETVRVAPEIDAYAFSFNEALSLTKIRHRCERCREIPFWQMILWLEESVRSGVESVNPKIRLFHRLWGLNEHDEQYYLNQKRLLDFTRCAVTKAWLPAHVKVYAPRAMHYKPSEDLARYLHLVKDKPLGFIAKATVADVALNMPLNPWIKHLKGHDAIVELSFERTSERPDGFHVLARQFQRAARLARAAGAAGVVGVPVHWGDKFHEGDIRRGDQDEGLWRLSLLNFDVIQAVAHNPDADLVRVIAAALRKRFGVRIPARLVEYVIESQVLVAGATNLRGIHAAGSTLDRMYEEILRYAPGIPDWEQRLARSPANLRRVLREKETLMARADAILADIRTFKGTLPPKAYAEFVSGFTDLRDSVHRVCKRQKLNFLLWVLKDRKVPCGLGLIREIERCL